jgi:histidyl-tRNA synthetase
MNTLGDPNCRPGYVDALRSYLRDRAAELTEDSVRLIDTNPLRVLDSKIDGPKLEDHPRMVDHLCAECSEHYAGVKKALADLDIPFVEDDGLVRGLDYYTRTTFEYIGVALDAAQNAVGGGGRYDGLAEAIGGRRAPGVGFALGIDRIMLSIGDGAPVALDAYLVSETGPEEALRVASRLRSDGLRIDFDTEDRSVKAQFRTASRLEAPVILVWKGEGMPVDIQTQEERTELPLEEVSNWFEDQPR